MPEIRLKSQHNEPGHSSSKPTQSRATDKTSTGRPTSKQVLSTESGEALRRRALEQLASIQLNTAGLSGPYRSDEETMERVCGNHAAVRSLRIVLRRSLILPRRGQLCSALFTWTLEACGGKHAQAARSLGITVRELRRVLEGQQPPIARRQTRLSLVE